MHSTLALANGQSVTGRVKNSDVTRQSEMGVRVKPEAFANAPAVEYYHAQTGWRIDERDILQMSLPRAKFVVREGVAAQAGGSGRASGHFGRLWNSCCSGHAEAGRPHFPNLKIPAGGLSTGEAQNVLSKIVRELVKPAWQDALPCGSA